MIPKVIHYCWFGGKTLPKSALKCINSWKKYCPDYKIIEWNEKNFNIDCCPYVREAYEEKKWAFVSDVARLYALVNYGGIYMDTDVEVIKPLDSLLKYDAVSGFENDKQIPTGLMACIKGQKFFLKLLHDYDKRHFKLGNGTFDTTTNVLRITKICRRYGFKPNNRLQTFGGFTLLPRDYLCPKDFETGKIHISKNTLTIHHFNSSWKSPEERFFYEKIRQLNRILPLKLARRVAKYISMIRFHGFISATKNLFKWILKKLKLG